MAKTRPSRKATGKARKAGKAKSKARSAKARRAKPVYVAKTRRKAPPPKVTVVEIPEIPPPLPAPIASFTF